MQPQPHARPGRSRSTAAGLAVLCALSAAPALGKPPKAAGCKVDADCVLVAEDCCDCAHGGKNRALAAADKDAYDKARAARCATTMCVDMISMDASCTGRASCVDAHCVVKTAAAPAPAPDPKAPVPAPKGGPAKSRKPAP